MVQFIRMQKPFFKDENALLKLSLSTKNDKKISEGEIM